MTNEVPFESQEEDAHFVLRQLGYIYDFWRRYYETYFFSIWYPSADQWNRTTSGWVPVIDQFEDFTNNFENSNLAITSEILFERLESESQHSTICNLYMPVFFCHWEMYFWLCVLRPTTRTGKVGSTGGQAGYHRRIQSSLRRIPKAGHGPFVRLKSTN